MCCLPGEQGLESLHFWEVTPSGEGWGEKREWVSAHRGLCLAGLPSALPLSWYFLLAAGTSYFLAYFHFTTIVRGLPCPKAAWLGRRHSPFPLFCPHPLPQPLSLFPGLHSSSQLLRQKFPSFSSLLFRSRPDCHIIKITLR